MKKGMTNQKKIKKVYVRGKIFWIVSKPLIQVAEKFNAHTHIYIGKFLLLYIDFHFKKISI